MSTEERGAGGFAAAGRLRADAGGRSYPCEACGATVEFAPGADALRCPYCGHQRAVAAVPRQVREHPIEELATLPAKPRAAGSAPHGRSSAPAAAPARRPTTCRPAASSAPPRWSPTPS